MAKRRDETTLRKLQNKFVVNVGTMTFGIVFLYILIYLLMYLTSDKITAYEVTAGSLSGNYRYEALAIKSELLVTCNEGGPIHYYARDGSKVGVGGGVYSIGTMDLATSSSGEALADLTNESYAPLHDLCETFAANYQSASYQNVSDFKADAQTAMIELLSQRVIESTEQGISAGLNLIPAERDGIVTYTMDGMEDLTAEQVTKDHFNQKHYRRENLRLRESVRAGDVVYKLLTSEDWSLLIPLDKKTAMELANQTIVRFRFMRDGAAFNAGFSILQNGADYFGKLDISNSLIRYAPDRYIEIELLVNRQAGLKIPNSAIAKKIFYSIPKEYVTVNDQTDNENFLYKESFGPDGSAITKVISATVYDRTEDVYYVDTSLFAEGDFVRMKDSAKHHQLMVTKSLTGVYNINNG